MKYILVLMLIQTNISTIPHTSLDAPQPWGASTTAEFSSKATCDRAAAAMRQDYGPGSLYISARCFRK